jgi:ABC-type antimicrobial peptide transport system permease subunit
VISLPHDFRHAFRNLVRSLAVSTAGLAAGLGLALVLAPLASSFLFGVEPRHPAVFAAAAATIALAVLAASLQPALQARRVDPREALRSESKEPDGGAGNE